MWPGRVWLLVCLPGRLPAPLRHILVEPFCTDPSNHQPPTAPQPPCSETSSGKYLVARQGLGLDGYGLVRGGSGRGGEEGVAAMGRVDRPLLRFEQPLPPRSEILSD